MVSCITGSPEYGTPACYGDWYRYVACWSIPTGYEPISSGLLHALLSYVVTILPQFRHCLRRMMLPSGRRRV